MALMLGKEKWDTLSALLHFYVTYIVGYNIHFQARIGLETKAFISLTTVVYASVVTMFLSIVHSSLF